MGSYGILIVAFFSACVQSIGNIHAFVCTGTIGININVNAFKMLAIEVSLVECITYVQLLCVSLAIC